VGTILFFSGDRLSQSDAHAPARFAEYQRTPIQMSYLVAIYDFEPMYHSFNT
jgi:hypothetical protein